MMVTVGESARANDLAIAEADFAFLMELRMRPSARIQNAEATSKARAREIASDDDAFEDFAFALTGKTADQRTAAENSALNQLRQEMRDGTIAPTFVEVAPANGPRRDRLPTGARGAFVAGGDGEQGRVLISGKLRGPQLQRTSDEETSEAIADRAGELGINLADGDAGARGAAVMRGETVSHDATPGLFEDAASDTIIVRSDGEWVEAAADADFTTAEQPMMLDVDFSSSNRAHTSVQVLINGVWVTVADSRHGDRQSVPVPPGTTPAQVRRVERDNRTPIVTRGDAGFGAIVSSSGESDASSTTIHFYNNRFDGSDSTVTLSPAPPGTGNVSTFGQPVYLNGKAFDLSTAEGQEAFAIEADTDNSGGLDRNEVARAFGVSVERADQIIELYGQTDNAGVAFIPRAGDAGAGLGIAAMVADGVISPGQYWRITVDLAKASGNTIGHALIRSAAARYKQDNPDDTRSIGEITAYFERVGISAVQLDQATDDVLGDTKPFDSKNGHRDRIAENFGYVPWDPADGPPPPFSERMTASDIGRAVDAGAINIQDDNGDWISFSVHTDPSFAHTEAGLRDLSDPDVLIDFLMRFDSNGDGVLNEAEFKRGMAVLGADVSDVDTSRLFMAFGYRNAQGALVLDANGMRRATNEGNMAVGTGDFAIVDLTVLNPVRIANVENNFDANGDGIITWQEFNEGLDKLDPDGGLTPQERTTAWRLYAQQNPNGSGRVMSVTAFGEMLDEGVLVIGGGANTALGYGTLYFSASAVTPGRLAQATLQHAADERGVPVESVEFVDSAELSAATIFIFGHPGGLPPAEADFLLFSFGVDTGDGDRPTHISAGGLEAAFAQSDIHTALGLGVVLSIDEVRSNPANREVEHVSGNEDYYTIADRTDSGLAPIEVETEAGTASVVIPGEAAQPTSADGAIVAPPMVVEDGGGSTRAVRVDEMTRTAPNANGMVTWTVAGATFTVRAGSRQDRYFFDYKGFSAHYSTTPSIRRHAGPAPNLERTGTYTDSDGNTVEIWAPREHQFETQTGGAAAPVESLPVVTINGEVVEPTEMFIGESPEDGTPVIGFRVTDPTTGQDTVHVIPASENQTPKQQRAIFNLKRRFELEGSLSPLNAASTDEAPRGTAVDPGEITRRIYSSLGLPAESDGEQVAVVPRGSTRVSREDVGIADDEVVSVDIGGEGPVSATGTGSAATINVQAANTPIGDGRHQTQPTTDPLTGREVMLPIPNLLLISDWDQEIPLADGFADHISLENAPLTDHNADEIIRLISPERGGQVSLIVTNSAENVENIERIANETGGSVSFTQQADGTIEATITIPPNAKPRAPDNLFEFDGVVDG